MLVNTMDFERVYVGGDIESLDVDFPALLRRRLEENWMYPFPKEVEIHYSSLGGKAVAYGAAGMVLDRLISEPGPARASPRFPRRRHKDAAVRLGNGSTAAIGQPWVS